MSAYLLIGSVLIGSVLTDDAFYFNPKPQDKNVIEGKPVILECGVGLGVGFTDNQYISIHWNHNNNRIVDDSRRYQRNGNLIIVYANKVKDLGQYTCFATNDSSGHSIQQTIELKVFWLNKLVRVSVSSDSIDSSNENEIILICETTGNPEPKIEWFRNGLKVHRTEQTTVRNKKLHIIKPSVAMNGIYSCRGSNSAAKLESTENFELKIKGEGVPQLQEISKYSIVKLDTSIALNCIYSDAEYVEWYAPNRDVPLLNNSRVTDYKNGSLIINRIEKEDNGIFSCVALPYNDKDPNSVQTYSIRLQISFLEDFSSDDLSATFASNLKMHVIPKNKPKIEFFCGPPNGIPKPKLWWEDPNGSIVSDTGRIRIDENTLIIDGPIKKSDAGKYECVAENMAAQMRKTFEIFVAIPPTLTDPNSIIADEDGFAYLHCLFSASPHTTVKWIKDGKYVQTSTLHSVLSNGSLIISRSQLTDSGQYQCEINSTGFQSIRSKSANLTIRERLKFSVTPTNTNLELNSYTKIICKARGTPILTVKWVKWAKEGQLKSLDWPNHIQDSNGTLHFNGVKREDAGNYTCIATNSQGIINASIQVWVTIRPKFITEPKSQSLIEGSSTLLDCVAEGDPIPNIQWDKDNVLNDFDGNRVTVFINGTLRIDNIRMEDSGKYGCTAGNSGGFSRTEVILSVNSFDGSSNHLGPNPEENKNKMTRTVTITLSAAALYMFLVMALMIYCRYRRAKRKATAIARSSQQNRAENGDLELKDRLKVADNPEQHRLLSTDEKQKQLSIKTSIRSEGDVHSQTSSNQSSKRSKSPFERLQICRQDLQRLCLLGHGEFGEVFLAKANKFAESMPQIVLVKALQSKDENIIFDYKREIEMFSKLSHIRIVRLIGLCRDTDPFLFVLEYSDWGDLKQFLLATRDDQTTRRGPKPTPLTLLQIIGISQQIAIAMEYLTNNRFVHKDLATRNCLITSKLDIKISSTSLSKDTYSSDYFNYQNRDVPIRWAPHEAVIEDEWSAKSDVYAFGVTVREMCTQAELPFHDKNDSLVIRLLQKNELKFEAPEDIPNPLKELLMSCWNTSPKNRPTFSDVTQILNKILLNLNN